MDRERCLRLLEGYGVGRKILRLIRFFWEEVESVCRALGNYGRSFKAYRGVTQGGPLSPKIFNFVVDAVVRELLRVSLGEDEARDGVGERFREIIAIFYADDGLLALWSPEQLQSAFDVCADLFA